MSVNRRDYLANVRLLLGNKRLGWFGARGDDAHPLLELPNFVTCISLIAPMHAPGVTAEASLEEITHRRIDLDQYDFDSDASPGAVELRTVALRMLTGVDILVPYRPLQFFSLVMFPLGDSVRYFGNFHEHQVAFENKPWVESELRKLGVRMMPWAYFMPSEVNRAVEQLASGPVVVRRIRSSGGSGLRLVESEPEFRRLLAKADDLFVAVCPFFERAYPLNVGGCVFPDASVTLHTPSVQLIGVEGCTTRRFGYCGNDFAAASQLTAEMWDDLERQVRKIGGWLAGKGYVGAFGVDALSADEGVYVTEINPRFQGSSRISADIDRAQHRVDLYLAHLGSFLGLPNPGSLPLRELARSQTPSAQVYFHNLDAGPVRSGSHAPVGDSQFEWQLLPEPATSIDSGGILCRGVLRDIDHTGDWRERLLPKGLPLPEGRA